MTAPFNRGTDCRASGSGGWCASAEDCQEACQVGGLPTSAQLRAARAETDRVVGVLIKMRAEREELQAELAKTQAALAASQADLTAALAKLAKPCGSCHPCDAYGVGQDLAEEKRLHARTVAQAAIDGAELASARKELEMLRPIADAARAYVTFPKRPSTSDPTEVPSWDDEMEGRYLALLNAVSPGTAA